jgi:AcrR family transcriptional regulator
VPRIKAATVAEHVRQQEDAILAASAALIAEHGLSGVDLGDIAEAVGLARSSLYRYFPDKDHIVLRWFERELEPVVATSTAIVEGPGTTDERVRRWVDFQLDYVADPAHQVAPRISQEIGALDPAVVAAIGAGHARLYATLHAVVAEHAGDHDNSTTDPAILTRLIGALVQAGGQALIDDMDATAVRAEVHRGVQSLLDPA